MNNLLDNSDNIFEILEYKDEHIINAEKILYDFDLLQEGEADYISKNIENFKINENLDLLKSNLNNLCNFTSPFSNTETNKDKVNTNDNESKFSSDLHNINNLLENINLGHLNLPELNKKLLSKSSLDESKSKSDLINKNVYLEINSKKGIKNDKESVFSQQSMINSNSTLNNNIAMLQTDSSFLSAYEENILDNEFKSKLIF